jgi:hypothetical protein
MAVVQISRIQIRRGKSLSGTGLPQLASGELAWSLDTQELYIGNGSVSEGAPAVGNTKILTERDLTAQGNLLNLLSYIYKVNDPAIQTGPSTNDPVSRDLQDRLDERVTTADFGTEANSTTDDTDALQRAIDQLFLNPTTKASVEDADGAKARVILELPPGIYKTTRTLYIPSYASLIGAGPNSTIISHTGNGPVIQFINDSSVIDNPSALGSTTANTQPRHIIIKGMTLKSNDNDQTVLQLDAVKDSVFEDLVIEGSWQGIYDPDSKGIVMNAVSSIVTCQDNVFNRINIFGFSFAVYANQDILNNQFTECVVRDCRQGFVLGETADGTTVGQQYGPRETQISSCKFEDIMRHAVYIGRGKGNTVEDSKLVNVGNDGAGVFFPEYPQMWFGSIGNVSSNNQSDREESLSVLSFTVDLTLSAPITASRGDTIEQNTTLVRGTLKQDYTSDSTITLVTRYLTEFNNFSNLKIRPVGETTFTEAFADQDTLTIVSSSSTAFTIESSQSTDVLVVGTPITFNSNLGGVTSGTTYYVQNIVDDNTFSISNTLGGPQRSLTVSTGNMTGTFNSSTHPTLVGDLSLIPYIPEVAGNVTYTSYATRQVNLGPISSPSLVTVLPISTGANGTASGSISYVIDYVFKADSNTFTRKGKISLLVDVDASDSTGQNKLQLSDDYVITGVSEESSLDLEFSAVLLNENGSVFGGTDTPRAVALRVVNDLASGTFTYSYTAIM